MRHYTQRAPFTTLAHSLHCELTECGATPKPGIGKTFIALLAECGVTSADTLTAHAVESAAFHSCVMHDIFLAHAECVQAHMLAAFNLLRPISDKRREAGARNATMRRPKQA